LGFCIRGFRIPNLNLLRGKRLGFAFREEISLSVAKPFHFAPAALRNARQFVDGARCRRCKTRGILHFVDAVLLEVCNCAKFATGILRITLRSPKFFDSARTAILVWPRAAAESRKLIANSDDVLGFSKSEILGFQRSSELNR
jgi:hypothetical protein